MSYLMVTLLPQMTSLLKVASAAFSAAPRVVNWTNAQPAEQVVTHTRHSHILTLLGDNRHTPHLPVGVESISNVVLLCALVQAAEVEGGDHSVLGRLQAGHGLGSLEDLVSHGVVSAIITVLHVLSRQRVVWV